METTKISSNMNVLYDRLGSVYKESEDRLFWEFEYSARHVGKYLYNESDQIHIKTSNFIGRHFNTSGNFYHDIEFMCEKSFLLIYAWHDIHCKSGFKDMRFADEIDAYKELLLSLPKKETEIIESVHNLSLKYGLLYTELCFPPSYMPQILDIFAGGDLKNLRRQMPPKYVFLKSDETLQGISVEVNGIITKRKIDWDIAVYLTNSEKMSHISTQLKNAWQTPGSQVIGDESNFQIAFFIDRKSCKSLSHTEDIIRLQIDHLLSFQHVEPVALVSENSFDDFENYGQKIDLNNAHMKYIRNRKKALASLIDRCRIGANLIHKHWDSPEGNIRRSVGLLLWDEIQASKNSKTKKELIEERIDHLSTNTLKAYHPLINNSEDDDEIKRLMGLASTYQTVIDKIYRDIELTDRCILDAKVHLPDHIKSQVQFRRMGGD